MPPARAARFLLSAPSWRQLPPASAPEVAFCGRSNVGKSSLVAALLGNRGLVRTSRTPGRTRLLNLFSVRLGGVDMAFCDLPGYGWARLSQVERRSLARMVRDYLLHRLGLLAVVLLVDGRHTEVSPLDVGMVAILREAGHPIWVVATKCDAVGASRRRATLAAIGRGLGLAEPPWGTSTRSGEGIAGLADALGAAAERPLDA